MATAQPAWLATFAATHVRTTTGPTCTCEPTLGSYEIRDRDCPAH